jgi:hypothetical protein
MDAIELSDLSLSAIALQQRSLRQAAEAQYPPIYAWPPTIAGLEFIETALLILEDVDAATMAKNGSQLVTGSGQIGPATPIHS